VEGLPRQRQTYAEKPVMVEAVPQASGRSIAHAALDNRTQWAPYNERCALSVGRTLRSKTVSQPAGSSGLRTRKMATGTVKWFNTTKGYGFIAPSDGSKDVFVHISALERAGLQTLNEGQTVGYELERGQQGRSSAINLQVG